MSEERWVNEPVMVQARFLPDGRITPTAFSWGGHTRYIASVGRQWVEEGPPPERHFLVQTAALDTFELALDITTLRWRLVRAWERPPIA
ncbi:MAG: hypothetical protein RML36_06630 [Anaerolineae bacterium]|nr:hypothetical protein [Anaerolineae bacterium]MDW8099144.1 hypothetical protein [Anaerolineae bacterium]